MRTFEKFAAQGDLFILKVDLIPNGFCKKQSDNGNHIVAHSETQHHHVIEDDDVDYYVNSKDMMKAYIEVKNIIGAQLKHLRDFDTHETILIPPGIYELRRQREYTPQGWRRVED
jgi:guanylate kinase